MDYGKPIAYTQRHMETYKIKTLTDLIRKIRICNEQNIPFVARTDDSGFVLEVEKSRSYRAVILPEIYEQPCTEEVMTN